VAGYLLLKTVVERGQINNIGHINMYINAFGILFSVEEVATIT
jgi:hypothetical protein